MRLRLWSRILLSLASGLAMAGGVLADEFEPAELPATVVLEGNPASPSDLPVPEVVPLGADDEFQRLSADYPGIADCGTVCNDCPNWTVRTGIVLLRRDNQDSLVLTNGATPITVDRLGFRDYEAGPLVTVIRHGVLNTAWDLDVTYFGVSDFQNTAGSAGATAVFSNPTINFGSRAVVSDYRSRINSTELNLRRDFSPCFTVLAGFRWVEISDVLSTDIGGGASHSVNVNNHLYGFQFGGQALLLHRGRFSIDAVVKAGVYSNQADQSTNTTGIGGALPAFSVRDSNVAFVGELGVTGAYRINDCWTIRGGYQAIWVDGIALAPDQIDDSDLVTGAATLDTSGHPIYHGFTLAAELGW